MTYPKGRYASMYAHPLVGRTVRALTPEGETVAEGHCHRVQSGYAVIDLGPKGDRAYTHPIELTVAKEDMA